MLTVVKIGGNVIDSPDALQTFLTAFAKLEGEKVLVHGGGKLATRLCERLGIETRMVEGRRITDAATLDVATMVYAGLTNKRIVAGLAARGLRAVGLCGADACAVRSVRRSPVPIDFGFVGDIPVDGVDAAFILSLTQQGIVPVFCAITHDGQGQLLNTNADSIASAIATALAQRQPTELVFCFEKNGVLQNIDDTTSVIPRITRADFARLKAEGVVAAGMLPKINNALAAVDSGVARVIIKSAEALCEKEAGTMVVG